MYYTNLWRNLLHIKEVNNTLVLTMAEEFTSKIILINNVVELAFKDFDAF